MITKNKGGRLTLAEQADNDHEKMEVRVDLAMAKALPKVIKHLLLMVNNMDKQKDNINLSLIDRVIGHNKDNRRLAREILNSAKSEETYEDEEESIMIDLNSSETASKTIQ